MTQITCTPETERMAARIAALDIELMAIRQRLNQTRSAVIKAETVFRRYGDIHAAKPDAAKAKADYALADEMAAAIRPPIPASVNMTFWGRPLSGAEMIAFKSEIDPETPVMLGKAVLPYRMFSFREPTGYRLHYDHPYYGPTLVLAGQ